MRTVQVKVKGLQLVNGIWRSRKVLPPKVAAIVGKSELTRTTGVAGEKDDMVALAKARDVAIREDHQGEFKRIIAEAREEANHPYNRLLKADPNARHLNMEEMSERAAELGICDDLFVVHVPKSPFEKLLDAEPSLRNAELHEITARLTKLGHTNAAAKEPVPFAVLLAAWELKNTNERTRRTKRRYVTRFAEHLGHDDANRVTPEDFAVFEGVLLNQANAGEIAHKSVENILAGIKAVFAAGLKAKKITQNPTEGISYQAPRSKMGKTLDYTIEQVGLILREGRNQPPHIRYPTLIAGFSGARVGEIADATTHDVYMVGDMYVLDIRTDYREDGQAIKNEPSIRKFPLHPQIIAEGFIDYWRSLPPGPLFPAFSLGHDKRRGDAASREISEWIRDDLVIKDPSPKLRYKPNHSFRNYVKTQWRNAKVEEETHDAITGHGNSKNESRNYGEYELKLMLEAIEKLPNPLVQGGADLAEVVAEDDRPGHFVTEAVA
jgi:integrase